MAKLRHIALSVPDPEKAADFYCEAFDMERVGGDSPCAGLLCIGWNDYNGPFGL